jgi:hypothetical protein
MGTGVNNRVKAIVVSGSTVYVGGWFTTAGGSPASKIAKWDGSNWSSLGTGLNGNCNALALDGSGNLYAGGAFTTAGGVTVNRIAKWDGSIWSALGAVGSEGLLGGDCNALYVDGSGNVYAGGAFTSAGGSSANKIAKWNGSSWSALGDGFSGGDVNAVLASGSTVYAGGSFDKTGGTSINRIAAYNGSTWSAMGDGVNSTVFVISGSAVYVGGNFNEAGTIGVGRIARWSGTNWYGVCSNASNGIEGYGVYAVAVSGSDVYVGGQFSRAGTLQTYNFAKWTASGWVDVGGVGGVSNAVYAITVSGSNVYVGGNFIQVGGSVLANYIACYNGSTWAALGTGLNNEVHAIAVDGSGKVYAGGMFTQAGGSPANRIAVWNSASWSNLGSGMNGTCVYALAIQGTTLYAGGDFSTAGGISASYIAQWNGSAWSAVGTGMDSDVRALAVFGGNLIAGGWFTTAGGNTANHIATWNGSTWAELGGGADYDVYALQVNGTTLYVGGGFANVNSSTAANGIASWNGSAWSTYGSGVNVAESFTVYAIGVGSLYIGGDFTSAGNKKSFLFGKYIMDNVVVLVETKVFMQGPYDAANDRMNIYLNTSGYVPATAPYTENPRTVSVIPTYAVDWVLLQLRTTYNGSAVVSKSVFLHRDGRLVADDGNDGQITLDVSPGNYYIIVKHRNHLAVMSADSIALNGSTSALYDFTAGSAKFFRGSTGAKEVETGKWGMLGGNANNSNTLINIPDYAAVKSNFAKSGYRVEDNNLSGVVNIPDYAITKGNFAKSSSVP